MREAHEACDAWIKSTAPTSERADACRTAVVAQFGVGLFREEQCAYVDQRVWWIADSVRAKVGLFTSTNYRLTDSKRGLLTDVISKCGGSGSDDVLPVWGEAVDG